MKRQRIIEDKIVFVDRAVKYFHYIFGLLINGNLGKIEIRAFRKRSPIIQVFFDTELAASVAAYKLCNRKYDVYFGFDTRIGGEGKKENGLLTFAYHASFDYGTMAHKHPPDYLTDVQPRDSRKYIPLLPSIIIHSGGRYDYYWVLNKPMYEANHGTDLIDRAIIQDIRRYFINRKRMMEIPRFLRVPGTYDFKDPNMLCEVELDYLGGKYDHQDIFEAMD